MSGKVGAETLPDQRGAGPGEPGSVAALHRSIAELLARRGQWQAAYEHARHALDVICAEQAADPPRLPTPFAAEVDQLRREHAEAREQAIRDVLTASYNRRYLDQRLVGPLPGGPDGLAVALVDLDRFKRVNDTFGHHVGDLVLQRVVELLQSDLPETGFCARYGGEEFVLVLPGIPASAAVPLAETIRGRVERYPWATIALGLRVTVSIGLAHQPPGGAPGMSPPALLRHADALLYAAKRSGRNAVAYHLDGQTRLAGPAAARRAIHTPRRLARPHADVARSD